MQEKLQEKNTRKMQSRKFMLNVSGIIIFLAAGAAAMFLTPSDKPATPPIPVQKEQPSPSPTPPEPAKSSTWYIYITGAVRSPGVYTLSEDSRIFQAVDAAGGFTAKADTTAINLADLLEDSAHVHIPERETFTPSPAPRPQTHTQQQAAQTQSGFYISGQKGKTTARSTNGSIMVDVNHATAKELEQLNGVGSAISKRIVEYRETHGRFNSPEDLINVRGIGSAKLEKMRSQILIR